MNGSKIVGYQCNIKISNIDSGTGKYLDVYSIATSFGDLNYANTLFPSEYPAEMLSDAANNSGTTRFKDPPVIWASNTYKNFKTMQRHIKHLGSLYISSEDGGQSSAAFTINGLPAKCRRANSGMLYGLMFHYDSEKNIDELAHFDTSAEIKFTELPSENRLPFRW